MNPLAWLRARRNIRRTLQLARPTIVPLPALELLPGDVLAEGGTVTSRPYRHPTGVVAVEVDWSWARSWPAEELVRVAP
jgi:hypothetical protein